MPEQVTVITSAGPPGSYERFVDTLTHYLANTPVMSGQPDTTVVNWVAHADIGMGPMPGLPCGFVAPLNDSIVPMGKGGSTGGLKGTDLDEFTVPILIVQAEHAYEAPVPVTVSGAANYTEAPGGRALMNLLQDVRKALRSEPAFGGTVATSTITEIRPLLIELDDKVFRGARLTVVARTRRTRG